MQEKTKCYQDFLPTPSWKMSAAMIQDVYYFAYLHQNISMKTAKHLHKHTCIQTDR